MKFPFPKPDNYEQLSFKDRLKFVNTCFEGREKIYSKFTGKFFGGSSDFSILLLNTIKGAVNNNDDNIHFDLDFRQPEQNLNDLEAAYDIACQFFLSNDELFNYVNERIKDKKLSAGFVRTVEAAVMRVKDKWNNFSNNVGFSDADSKKIRNDIKLGSVGCAATSLLCYGLGFFGCIATTASVAASTVSCITSGECGDSLAMVTTNRETFSAGTSSGRRGETQYQYQQEIRMPGYLTMKF